MSKRSMKTKPKKNGRPLLKLDFTDIGKDENGRHLNKQRDQFEYLCSIFCTQEEIAAVFQCSVDTIQDRVLKAFENKSFSEVHSMFRKRGNSTLRRYQFEMAKTIPYMSVWLGKQYLGQSDKIDQRSQTQTTHRVELSEKDKLDLIDAIKTARNEKLLLEAKK